MKNLIKRIAFFGLFSTYFQIGFTQVFEIDYTNTQVCLGSVSVQVYDASNVALLPSPINLPPGSGTAIIGSCTSGLPAYLVLTDGSCSITVNVNTTYNCPASTPCTCSCIGSGRSFQVILAAQNCSSPPPPAQNRLTINLM